MPTLITNFNWGTSLNNQNPLLTRQMSEAYTQTALCVNTKISKFVTTRDPPSSITSDSANPNFELGDIWVNTSTDNAWIMTSRTTNLIAKWVKIT